MATITILTPEELDARETKPREKKRSGRQRSAERERIITVFKETLKDAEPGVGADVLLAEGEEKRLVRMNLKTAAEELNKALDFRPIKDKSRIHFRVMTPEEKAAKPRRGGGRPKKQAA